MKKDIFVKGVICLLFWGGCNTASATLLMNFSATDLGVVGGGTYDSLGMTVDGITVNISAYTIENDGSGNISSLTALTGGTGAYVNTTNSGNLGVRSRLTGDGVDMDGGYRSSDLDEGLLFSFSEIVDLSYIDFDSFTRSGGDDFNLTVDGVRILWDHNDYEVSPWVNNVAGQFDEYTFNNLMGMEFLFWADGSSDSFRIDQMIVSSVPEPATILLFGVGCLGMRFMGFKRRV